MKVVLFLVALLVVGCTGDDAPGGPDADADTDADTGPDDSGDGDGNQPVTYYEDIKPLLDARCGNCHVDGGIAPFALQGYEAASAYAGVSSLAVHEGTMPPWLPADDCNDYEGDRSLSAAEIELFDAWVEGGLLEGDPANEGPALPADAPSLSRVDLELGMTAAYTPQLVPDDYRCFVLPWPENIAETRYVTGFGAAPGNEGIVHHVIAYLATPDQSAHYAALDAGEDGPGYTCFGGTNGPARAWLGSWAPGSFGNDLPEGIGIPVEPGSTIILQMHYNSLAPDPSADQTSIQLKLEDSVEQVARIQPWTNPSWLQGDNMLIPAGNADVVHRFAFDPTQVLSGGRPFAIHSSFLHMHQIGKSGHLRVRRSGNDDACVLDIDRWDFNWQDAYQLREPVVVNPGDQLELECRFDNSQANQPVVDGEPQIPVDRAWGEGTGDEMCLGGFLMTVEP